MNVLLRHPGVLCPTLLGDIFVFGLIFVSAKYMYKFVRRLKEQQRLSSLIPSPKHSLIYGHLSTLTRDQAGLFKRVELLKDYPAMYCFYIGSFLYSIAIHHPDLAKILLNSDVGRGIMLKQLMKESLGEGLLSSDGGTWHRKRHMLTPAFHFEILKSYAKVFNETIDTTLQWLEDKAQSRDPCDIHVPCSHLSFDNMTQCIMSQPAVNNGENYQLIENLKKLEHLATSRFFNPLLYNDMIYNCTSEGRDLKKIMFEVDVAINKIIQDRRNAPIKENVNYATKQDVNSVTDPPFPYKKRKGKRIDFLDILLQSKDEKGEGLSEKEIRDEVRLFFAAGSETTGSAMTWLAYLFAQNQDWQEKCREEIRTVCQHTSVIEWDDIPKLKILHMCIKESLRLYPIAASIGREVTTSLSFTDPYDKNKTITLKKGMHVLMCIFALHRHPEFWKDPHVFDPERFTVERSKDRPPYAYLPFSAGPKNCIGQNFAMLQMKVSFAHILQKYRLLPAPELPPPEMVPEITLKPKDHVYVRVESI